MLNCLIVVTPMMKAYNFLRPENSLSMITSVTVSHTYCYQLFYSVLKMILLKYLISGTPIKTG